MGDQKERERTEVADLKGKGDGGLKMYDIASQTKIENKKKGGQQFLMNKTCNTSSLPYMITTQTSNWA